jgi:DNA polymerase type B, organellar and viral
MIYSHVYIPRFIRDGIKPNHRGSRMDKLIYGADTETVNGRPNTIQFYSEDVACSDIFFVDEKSALKTFLNWCDRRRAHTLHVIYMHNLKFDLTELFYGKHHLLAGDGGDFEFTAYGWRITGVHGTPTFCRLTKHSRSIALINSFSFYQGSLESAARLYCPDLPKLKHPKDLGSRRITPKDTDAVAYALRDAEITYHIGRAVEDLHREFEIRQALSIADLSATIFRHRFLSYVIPAPTSDIILAALDSYHGGKNNITVPAGWYRGSTGVDLSSAYPRGMHELPAFSDGRLYRRFKNHRRVKRVPPYGIYRTAGTSSHCQWPVLFGHDFTPLRGDFNGVHIQGLEINEALDSGELKLSSLSGWYYDADRDRQAPALRAFVEDFYQRKEHATDPVRRHGYKIILNSLYGKFIQTRKDVLRDHYDIDTGKISESGDLIAGGLFQPFMASAITAHCRVKIHSLEHQYEALHTATDGIFTQKRVRGLPAKGLGNPGVEVKGDLLLLRNKLYIVYGDKPQPKSVPSRAYPGKHILKYAKHGFQGSVFELERMAKSGRRSYRALHVNQLRESLSRGLQVNEFVKREMRLNVGVIR